MKKKGRDNPTGLTAMQVIEDIAAFPLNQDFERDEYGSIKNGSSSHSAGFAAYRNQKFARDWLEQSKEK